MKRFFFLTMSLFVCLSISLAVDYKPYQPAQQAQIKGYNDNALNATAPTYEFNGTSSMVQGSYTVPVAVLDPETMTLLEDPTNSSSNPRRIGHRPDPGVDPIDPTPTPDMSVGNTPWLWMALMALAYIAMRTYRTRNSGVQD